MVPDYSDDGGGGAGEGSGEEAKGDGLTVAERQQVILHRFYNKVVGEKSEAEVAEILAKRKGSAETLSDKAFDGCNYTSTPLSLLDFQGVSERLFALQVCSKLEEKYGENPASLYAVDRAMGEFDDDESTGRGNGGESSGGDGWRGVDWGGGGGDDSAVGGDGGDDDADRRQMADDEPSVITRICDPLTAT